MRVILHPHALLRLGERGASEDEVVQTVLEGERFAAKFGRSGFRHNFVFGNRWQNRLYANKQVEAYAVEEDGRWLVITMIVRFF